MQLGGSNSGSDSNNNDNSSPFRNQFPNSLLDVQINPRNPDWGEVLRDIKDDLRAQHRWDMLRDMEQNTGGRNTARNPWGGDNMNLNMNMNMSNTNVNNTMSEEPGVGGTASGASGDSSGGSAGRPAAVKYKVRTEMERGARNDPFRVVDTQQTPSISQGTSDATLGAWMQDRLMGVTMGGPGGVGETNSSGTGGSNSNNTGSNRNSNPSDQGFTLGKSQRDDIGGLSMAAVAWNTAVNVEERRVLETDNDRIAYIGESQKKTNRTENPPNVQAIRAASSGSGSSSHNSSDKQRRVAGGAAGSQDSSGYAGVGSPGHNASALRKVSVGEDTGYRDPLDSFDINSSALAADAMSTDTNTMMAAAEWAYREAAGGGAVGYDNLGDNGNDANYPESASATSGSGSQASRGHSQDNSESNDPTGSGSRPRSSDPSSGGRDFSTLPGADLIENLDPENMNQLVSDAMQGRLATDLQRSLRNATQAAAEADAAVEAASFAYRASLSAMEKAANESLEIQEMTKKLVAAARDAYIRARVTALAGRKSMGISKENVETEKRGFDTGLWDCIDVALQGGSGSGSGSGSGNGSGGAVGTSGSGGRPGTSGSGGRPGPSGSSGQPGTSGSGGAAGSGSFPTASGSFPTGQGGVLSGSVSGPTGSTGQSGHTGSSGGSYENSEEKRLREVQRQQQENRRQKHDTQIQQEEQDLVEIQRQLLEERERDLVRAQNRLDLEVRYDEDQRLLIQQKDNVTAKQMQQARTQERVRHKQRARVQQSTQIQQEIRRQQERRELDDTRTQREGTQKQEEIKQQQDEIRQQQMQIQQQQMQLDVQRRQLEQLQQQQIQLLQQQRQFLQYAAGSGFSNGSSGPSTSLTGSDNQQGDDPGQRIARERPDNLMANQPRPQQQPQSRPQEQSIGCHLCGADCTQRKAVYCSRSACMKWYCEQCLQYLLPADSLESVINGTRSFLCFHCRKCCPQWSKCMSPESM
eukprot:CAMPEP_0184697836 /NCGR_PEP_ID=MMETSP0313-20130426/4656_1 /TAXON_ID=2792 /ORGANISM="Porphyridium aerugineum, Strain SAG 1380-2" /LENGTH=978 /DNA_ID=CAMNT_0027156675 /DNA_START=391 /DNA_END=3327 /DNA_ORIENTATION=+